VTLLTGFDERTVLFGGYRCCASLSRRVDDPASTVPSVVRSTGGVVGPGAGGCRPLVVGAGLVRLLEAQDDNPEHCGPGR
jgi:hypothetical protein